MADETIIIDVVLNTKDQVENAARLRTAIDELKKTQEDLRKNNDANSVQYEANAAALRDLQAQYRQATKDIDNVNKQIQAETGSIAANRAELARLTAEYIKLAKPTAEQTARIKTLSDQLKAQEKAIGDTRRNVGNYADGVREAFANSQVFGGAINGISQSMSLLSGGPLLIAVGLFAKLVDVFAKFNVVLDPAQQLLGGINAVASELVSRVSDLGKGIGAFVTGNFSQGIEQIKNSFSGLSTSINAAFKEGQRFVEFQQRLEDVQRTLTVRNAEAAKQVDVLIAQSRDRSKTEQERIKILEEAGRVEKNNFNVRLQVAKTEELLAQQQLKRARDKGQETDDLENKAAQATVNRLNLERESLALQERIQGRINQLIESESSARQQAEQKREAELQKKKEDREKELKSDADFYEKLSQNIKKAEEDRIKQQEADSKTIAETRKKEYEDSLNFANEYYTKLQTEAKLQYANGEISEQEYRDKIKEIQSQSLESQLTIQKDYGESTVQVDAKIADEKVAKAEEVADEEERLRKEKEDAERALADSLVGLANAVAMNSKDNAEMQKAIAVFQLAIDSAMAIGKVTSTSAAGDPYTYAIRVAANVATVLANIARATAILSAAPKQFYEGGYTGDGDPRQESTAVGKRPYIYHKQEYIIPHKLLAEPVVSSFVSNVIEPKRRGKLPSGLPGMFDGGFATTNVRSEVNASLQSNALIKAIGMMRPVVQVSEINTVQQRVKVLDTNSTL